MVQTRLRERRSENGKEDQMGGSKNNPKHINSFTTPKTFLICLQKLVSIEQKKEGQNHQGRTCLSPLMLLK